MNNKKSEKPNVDEYNLKCILISFDLIFERVKGYSYERLINNMYPKGDLVICDSLMFRMREIVILYGELSTEILNEIEREDEILHGAYDNSMIRIHYFFRSFISEYIESDFVEERYYYEYFIQSQRSYKEEEEAFGTFKDYYKTINCVYNKIYNTENYQGHIINQHKVDVIYLNIKPLLKLNLDAKLKNKVTFYNNLLKDLVNKIVNLDDETLSITSNVKWDKINLLANSYLDGQFNKDKLRKVTEFISTQEKQILIHISKGLKPINNQSKNGGIRSNESVWTVKKS